MAYSPAILAAEFISLRIQAGVVAIDEEQSQQETGDQPEQQLPASESSSGSRPTSKLISRKFSVAVCLLLLLAMCVFWLISAYNTRNLLRLQADELGQVLASQTAEQVTELVLAGDLISINVILGNLIEQASIAEISVLNIDNQLLASASGRAPQVNLLLPIPLTDIAAEYTAPITLANATAGYVRVTLDLGYIEAGLVNNLLLIAGATLLLLLVAALLVSNYFQYLVSFPARTLAFALSNIRTGQIDTCAEPAANSEIAAAIRQFNATAEFLAQNTFLSNFSKRQPDADSSELKAVPGRQDVSLLVIRMSNFHYLASTESEETMVRLLNKYYFFAGKVSQLYNGSISYCWEDEVIVNFSSSRLEDEQAFYAICAAQLFMQLVGDIRDIEGEEIGAKFRLAVHSGQTVAGLYSPISQSSNSLTGKTLDLAREIVAACPDGSLLISAPAFEHAGAGSRIEADEYQELGQDDVVLTYIGLEPLSEYRLLLERQAIQLVTLFAD